MLLDDLGEIVSPLLIWYRARSRILPWRRDREPYRVWVSEIMLQQTRVEAVIPYYERFMERFPTVQSLAECDDEELLKLWEGLGYYSRARNLKKAAQVICDCYQGQFPQKFEDILRLSGIGAYTAGAIASIAFEQARAAVDGNVLRVVTRLSESGQDIMDSKFRKMMTAELERIYPRNVCGDFTQSLMELGAIVCVPNGKPKCMECPLKHLCGAYQNQTQMEYPVRKKKAKRRIEEKTVLLLRNEDKIAIGRRGAQGLLSGMWELPNIDGHPGERELIKWLADRKIVVTDGKIPQEARKQAKHIFTHVEWHMECLLIFCETAETGTPFTWVTKEQLDNEVALPTAFKKVYMAMMQI